MTQWEEGYMKATIVIGIIQRYFAFNGFLYSYTKGPNVTNILLK